MKKIIISIIIIAVVVSVGAGFWYIKNKGLPPEAPNGLMIYSLKAGDEISSPLEISGYVYANGWGGFEGQVGSVRLLDNNGNEIALAILTATSDWMTDKINFSTILEFESLNSQEGVLVFMNENPSGLAENSREFNLPVRIAVTASETMKVKVYYSNSVKDPELFCENVYSVEREIPKTEGVARAALEELLKGPTDSEKAEGFSTGINPGVTIQS
ncbi:MAG: Gmad2 immunoglobulin-like domain-containing protein, partial [Candidatus Staskawiczbacteria bacterium]